MPTCRTHYLAGGGIDGFNEGCSAGVQGESFEALGEALLADGVGGADVQGFVDLPPYFWERLMHAPSLGDASVVMK